jgi:hypothetical protein
MAKKTKVTQRAREEQWRRRVEQQGRQSAPAASRAAAVEDAPEVEADATEYVQADLRPMPSGVSTSARATAAPAARTTRTTATSTAANRRSATATRAARLGFQQMMSVEEEMRYVRGDIRSLIILTAICLAVLIALAFVIPR